MVLSGHARKKEKKASARAAAVTVLIVLIGVSVFLFRDKLSPAALGGSDSAVTISSGEPFTYETGSKQLFALMGDSLAIASTTGLQILDASGKTVVREVFSMTSPAVCAGSDVCAFFDVGGKSLRIFQNKESHNLDREQAITAVTVSSGGYFAVTGDETGYKGSVTVLGHALDPVYKWYSGTDYPLDAAVSPDNSTLAVLCVGASGSVVHIMKLDSENETAAISIPDELAFNVRYTAGGNLYVLSEDAIRFYSGGGEALNTYSFEDNYLANYALSEDYCAVVLSKYISGADVSLLSFGNNGAVLGTVKLSEEPLSLSVQKQKLLVLDASSVSLYSDKLGLLKQNHTIPGYIAGVLLPKSEMLLLSSHYGQKCAFNG